MAPSAQKVPDPCDTALSTFRGTEEFPGVDEVAQSAPSGSFAWMTVLSSRVFFQGFTLVTVTTFWETANISSEYGDGHKARFSVFGGGCAARLYCILRDR